MQPPLHAWGLDGEPCEPLHGGLINRTFLVGSPDRAAVMQWVNPIFGPDVHYDIQAVTAHLAAAGLATPRLIPTVSGALWHVEPEGGCWRLLSRVAGETFHRVGGAGQAAAAGRLVARFHRAMEGFEYTYRHVRPGFHDTPLHMRLLEAGWAGAVQAAPEAASLAGRVLDAWERCRAGLPEGGALIHGHGDLKISNLLFDTAGEGICLVDLDTLGRMPLAVELGDALRSWCNPTGEDHADAAISPELYRAALAGYTAIRPLSPEEQEQVASGVEQIALELAARFCRDVWEDNYFGWDAARFPSRAAHNLHRARGQFSLAGSVRTMREALLTAPP